jgi:hypothetical protein
VKCELDSAHLVFLVSCAIWVDITLSGGFEMCTLKLHKFGWETLLSVPFVSSGCPLIINQRSCSKLLCFLVYHLAFIYLNYLICRCYISFIFLISME